MKKSPFDFRLMSALLVFTAALSACDSTPAHKSISYVRPATPGGRMCIDQCGKSRSYCQDSCNLDNRACYNDVQATAQKEYDAYARARFAKHVSVDMMPSDFERPEKCESAKQKCLSECDEPYKDCYSDCGGQVNVTTSCQFMCFD